MTQSWIGLNGLWGYIVNNMTKPKVSEQEKLIIALTKYVQEEIKRLMAKGHYGKLIIEFQAGNVPFVRSEDVKSAREIVEQYYP